MKRPSELLFLMGCTIWCLFQLPLALAGEEETFSITHGPYLSYLSTDVAMINWSTNQDAVSTLEWQGEDGNWHKVVPTHDGLVLTGTTHSVQITGLSAGQTYNYRISAKQIRYFGSNNVNYGGSVTSNTYSFETLNPERTNFTAYVFNDIHNDLNKLGQMLQHITLNPGDLVFFNGDMVDDLVEDNRLNELIDLSVARFATQFPIYYLRGNHETRGRMAREFGQRFPQGDGHLFSSLVQGPAQFFLLDSGEDKEDDHQEYGGLVDFDFYRSQIQTPWLRAEVEKSLPIQPVFKVALVHMPIFGGANWHGERQIRGLWQPLLNKADINVEISGHTHVRLWVPADHIFRRFPVMVNGIKSFVRLNVTRDQMTLEVIDVNGKVIDRHTFKP